MEKGFAMAGKALRAAAEEPTDSSEVIRHGLVAKLAAEIARIEQRPPTLGMPAEETGRRARFGIAEIDAALGSPGEPGLAVAALHEVRAALGLDAGAAAGFALALGGLLSGFEGLVFWVAGPGTRSEAGHFHGPGLVTFGLDPARLVRIHAGNCRDALWAAGEIAATRGVGLCLVELRANPAAADLTFSRRLAMRAAASGVPVILLRQGGAEEAGAAITRWSVSAAPSLVHADGTEVARKWLGPPAWCVTLEKSRSGRTGNWMLEWNRNERLLALLPDTRNRLARGRPGSVAGAVLSGAGAALSADRPRRTAALGG